MKTKLMLISIMTAACIFVFTGAAWADGKKDRRNKNPKQKHYTVSKHHKPDIHQNHWKKESGYHGKRHPDHKRYHRRDKYHRHGSHDRKYQHKPYYRHHDKNARYFKSRHYRHRPVKKYRHNQHHRPIYSHTDGSVSILAATSDQGWSIKISSKD